MTTTEQQQKAERIIAACERMLEVCAKATPGPWEKCKAKEGKCQCGQIWSTTADMPVCSCNSKWGDGCEGTKTWMEYGNIGEEAKQANKDFIAQARTMTEPALQSTVIGLRGQLRFLTWDNAIVRKEATEILTDMLAAWPEESQLSAQGSESYLAVQKTCTKIAAERDALRSDRDERVEVILQMEKEYYALKAERDTLRAEYAKLLERQSEERGEYATLEQERDALRAERDSGLWVHGRPSPLRAEVARQAAVITEHEHQRATATAEIDRLDAIRRQQEQDNLELIERLDRLQAKYVETDNALLKSKKTP